MALHSLYCADVPLRNCSLTHSLNTCMTDVLVYCSCSDHRLWTECVSNKCWHGPDGWSDTQSLQSSLLFAPPTRPLHSGNQLSISVNVILFISCCSSAVLSCFFAHFSMSSYYFCMKTLKFLLVGRHAYDMHLTWRIPAPEIPRSLLLWTWQVDIT